MDMDTAEPNSDQENNNSSRRRRSSMERKLCYRDLLNQIEDIDESQDLGLQTVKGIGNILKKVNDLEVECNISERVEYADETLLDSKVLLSASGVLLKCVEAVDVFTSTYEPTDFAQKIAKYVGGDAGADYTSQNLVKLLEDARQIIPQMPQYCYTYGAYDLNKAPEPKQKKERQKRVKENCVKKQPEKVTNLEKEEKGIEEIVKVFHAVLMEAYNENDREPIKYYDYVIDTESYGTTIENMFYCAFLIRDGKAHIDIDGKGVPFIRPSAKKQLKEFRDQGGSNFQMISSITMPVWETYKYPGLLQRRKNTS